MSNGVTIDTKQVEKYLDSIKLDIRGAEVKGLHEILVELTNKTKSNLVQKIPSANRKIRPFTVRGSKYATNGDSLLDAVRRSIHKKGDTILEGTVHIMGSKDKGSGTFITRFFEGGTKIRRTKTKGLRGMIRPLNFFNSAVTNVNSKINEILLRSVEDTINKINAQNG